MDDAIMARRAYQQKWRNKNRDKIRAYKQQWRAKNRDHIREYERDYWARRAAAEALVVVSAVEAAAVEAAAVATEKDGDNIGEMAEN